MDYDFETRVPVRFKDIDLMGHVNNAVYSTYLEEARMEFYREVLGESAASVDIVLASLSIEFRTPIEVTGDVEIGLRVTNIGEASIAMKYDVIGTSGEVAATAESVQVAYDPKTESSRPIPPNWRAAIESV